MNRTVNEMKLLGNGYQEICILGAACELDLFAALNMNPNGLTACELALRLELDLRALEVLLTALHSLGYVERSEDRYTTVNEYRDFLDPTHPDTAVPMIRHQMCCLRSWSQLAWSVKSGVPAPKVNSILGPLGDYNSFILGMNTIARRVIKELLPKLKEAGLLEFRNMLDLGGASGTYTIAFLEANSNARATILDLPPAIKEANKRRKTVTCGDRIDLYEADFYKDAFPTGFDFVWISAIIHQQNEEQTLEMFRKSFDALEPNGRIAIRDIYIRPDRSGPTGAALFGVNMLCNTSKGRVYTKEEVFRLLLNAGFVNPRLAIDAEDMTAVIVAEKGAP